MAQHHLLPQLSASAQEKQAMLQLLLLKFNKLKKEIKQNSQATSKNKE